MPVFLVKPLRVATAAALISLATGVATFAHAQTPAEHHMARAERIIATSPNDWGGYNELALAYARRARETSSHDWYVKGEETLAKLPPAQRQVFEVRKTDAWLQLGQHRFQKAYGLAKALVKQTPDDVQAYGLLADAAVEIGRYDEAEKAVQWMLDIRPGNVPAFTRAAYLRELFGDEEGAIELMQKAYQRTLETEVEDRAWILTHIGHLETRRARFAEAERALQGALKLFPDYHYALARLANLRSLQGRYADAAALFAKRYAAADHPENLYDLAVAERLAGQTKKARASFIAFEKAALKESGGEDNANHELTAYYLNVAGSPKQALKIAQAEFERRQDWRTRLALAEALRKTGRSGDAEKAIAPALELGVRHAPLWLAGAEIARANGQKNVAIERLRSASALVMTREQKAQSQQLGKAVGVSLEKVMVAGR
jgi:Flp pilus assembly protein TadD